MQQLNAEHWRAAAAQEAEIKGRSYLHGIIGSECWPRPVAVARTQPAELTSGLQSPDHSSDNWHTRGGWPGLASGQLANCQWSSGDES